MSSTRTSCFIFDVRLLGLVAAAVQLLTFTAAPATAQDSVVQPRPKDVRASASDVARANSQLLIEIKIRRTVYDLTCTPGSPSQRCSVAPAVAIDKASRDDLTDKGTSFLLRVCTDRLGSCRRNVPWSPNIRDGETALEGTGVSPGSHYLSWTINERPDAAISNELKFTLTNPTSIRKQEQ